MPREIGLQLSLMVLGGSSSGAKAWITQCKASFDLKMLRKRDDDDVPTCPLDIRCHKLAWSHACPRLLDAAVDATVRVNKVSVSGGQNLASSPCL